jgi:biopolymer transport protein ExbB
MLDYVINYLDKGGWVLAPIFITSIAGWFIIFRSMFTLRFMTPSLRQWDRKIRYARGIMQWVEGSMSKRDERSVPGVCLKQVYALRSKGRLAMLDVYDREMKFAIPQMEKGMSTLGVLASVAPLLGLLGTVSGMVGTFDTISIYGAGNPALMADNIGEALVTTQNGLLAAIPLMLGHILLSTRAIILEKDTEKAVHALINYFNHFEQVTQSEEL